MKSSLEKQMQDSGLKITLETLINWLKKDKEEYTISVLHKLEDILEDYEKRYENE